MGELVISWNGNNHTLLADLTSEFSDSLYDFGGYLIAYNNCIFIKSNRCKSTGGCVILGASNQLTLIDCVYRSKQNCILW